MTNPVPSDWLAFSKGSFVLSARTGLNVLDRDIGREARPSITVAEP